MSRNNGGTDFSLIIVFIFMGAFIGCSTAVHNESKIEQYHEPCYLTISKEKPTEKFTIFSGSGKEDVQIQYKSKSGDTGFLKFKCND